MSEFERLYETIRRVVWDDPTWKLLGDYEEAIDDIPVVRALLQVAGTQEEREEVEVFINQIAVECMHDHQVFRRLLALDVGEKVL